MESKLANQTEIPLGIAQYFYGYRIKYIHVALLRNVSETSSPLSSILGELAGYFAHCEIDGRDFPTGKHVSLCPGPCDLNVLTS
jgi:hypothetical protein